MKPRVIDGWLVIPYDGSDRVAVHISIEPDEWLPAFLDYDADGQRIAKVRLPAGVGSTVIPTLLASGGSTTYRAIKT